MLVKLDLLKETPEELRLELIKDSNKLFAQAGKTNTIKSIWLSIPGKQRSKVTEWQPAPNEASVYNVLCKLANFINTKGYLNHFITNGQSCRLLRIKEITSLCLSEDLIEFEPNM